MDANIYRLRSVYWVYTAFVGTTILLGLFSQVRIHGAQTADIDVAGWMNISLGLTRVPVFISFVVWLLPLFSTILYASFLTFTQYRLRFFRIIHVTVSGYYLMLGLLAMTRALYELTTGR